MAEYNLEITQGLKNIYKKYIGTALSTGSADAIANDITNYLLPTDAISIELKKGGHGKYYILPKNLYTFLIIKGIHLPYQLVNGKDSIQVGDEILSFVDGKPSIKPFK